LTDIKTRYILFQVTEYEKDIEVKVRFNALSVRVTEEDILLPDPLIMGVSQPVSFRLIR